MNVSNTKLLEDTARLLKASRNNLRILTHYLREIEDRIEKGTVGGKHHD